MSEMLNELQASIRQVMDDKSNGTSEQEIWPQLAELGWLLVGVDEEKGGLEQGLAGMCLVVREMARRVSAAPIIPALLTIDAIAYSNLVSRDALLENLMYGGLASCSLASSELQISDNKINGTLTAVPSADNASAFLVWDKTEDMLALVDAATVGIEIAHRPTWDSTRRLFDVAFSNVALPESAILSRDSASVASVLSQRDFLIAADCLGAAEGVLAMTLEHLMVREQFSRPLAMFQALKHRCADIKSQIVAAESLLMDKLVNAEDLALAGATVKQFNSEVFSWAAEDALQLHGGVGMASEHDCHLFLKRAMLNKHLGHTDKQTTQILVANFI